MLSISEMMVNCGWRIAVIEARYGSGYIAYMAFTAEVIEGIDNHFTGSDDMENRANAILMNRWFPAVTIDDPIDAIAALQIKLSMEVDKALAEHNISIRDYAFMCDFVASRLVYGANPTDGFSVDQVSKETMKETYDLMKTNGCI